MPRRVEFKGKVHEFPDNATDEQVRAALTLNNPKSAVTENPETFLGGIWKNVNPKALVDLYKSAVVEHQGDIGRALAASMLKASGHQAEKAKEAFKAGRYSETLGHALAAIPGLSSFADAAETMGGEPGETDKFGNVVKSGVAPNLAGGAGEAVGAAAPLLVGEVAKIPGAGEAVQTAGTAARGAIVEGAKAAVSPSTMVGAGTAEFLGSHVGLPRGVGAASVALPRIVGASVRGAKAALADRVKAAAAKVAEAVPVLEIPPLYDELAGGPGKFAKMSPEDQMALRSVADRIQNGVSGSAADLEAVAQRKARAMAAQGGGSPAVPIPEAQPVQVQSPEATGRLPLPNVQGSGGPRRIPMPVGPQAPIVPDVAQQLRESLVPESKAAPGEVATIAGSEPEFAPETYAASARVPKVQKLAAALNEHGIGYEDARTMDMSHWKMLSEATGQKIPSATTIEQTLFELKKLEKGTQPVPPKPEKVSPASASEAGTRTQPKPNMVEASRALAEELGMVEKSAKAPLKRGEVEVYRSSHESPGIDLNDQGILYTSPSREYSAAFGDKTARVAANPGKTLDLTVFQGDSAINPQALADRLSQSGVRVSKPLMERLTQVAEDGGAEMLQYFGKAGKQLREAITKAGYKSAKINEYHEQAGMRGQSLLLFDSARARLLD